MPTQYPLPGFPTIPYPSEGWILDEDRALRDHLKGVVVSDQQNPSRSVEVWFGHPDQEIREQKYPYITVDLLNIAEGVDRVHRGDYFTNEVPAWWGLEPLQAWQVGYLLEMPTPVDLDYQVATWARNPRHDRQILQQLITDRRTRLRAGRLFTADGKVRRLDFIGHNKRDIVDANSKRLFNNIFRLRVSSEIPWHDIGVTMPGEAAFGPVTSIETTVRAMLDVRHPVGMADSVRFSVGEVTAVQESGRTADVDIKGTPRSEVPLRKGLASVGVGDLVSVLEDAEFDQDPSDPDLQTRSRRLIIGVEYKAEQ